MLVSSGTLGYKDVSEIGQQNLRIFSLSTTKETLVSCLHNTTVNSTKLDSTLQQEIYHDVLDEIGAAINFL
jgi:hypothetical protein